MAGARCRSRREQAHTQHTSGTSAPPHHHHCTTTPPHHHHRQRAGDTTPPPTFLGRYTWAPSVFSMAMVGATPVHCSCTLCAASSSSNTCLSAACRQHRHPPTSPCWVRLAQANNRHSTKTWRAAQTSEHSNRCAAAWPRVAHGGWRRCCRGWTGYVRLRVFVQPVRPAAVDDLACSDEIREHHARLDAAVERHRVGLGGDLMDTHTHTHTWTTATAPVLASVTSTTK